MFFNSFLIWLGEAGTGLGPTLEFFTLLSHHLQRKGLGLWQGDDTPRTAQHLPTVVPHSFGLETTLQPAGGTWGDLDLSKSTSSDSHVEVSKKCWIEKMH